MHHSGLALLVCPWYALVSSLHVDASAKVHMHLTLAASLQDFATLSDWSVAPTVVLLCELAAGFFGPEDCVEV